MDDTVDILFPSLMVLQVKLWDTRQPTPVHNIQLTDRAYSMDARGPAMVVGTGDRKLAVFDITQGRC